MKVYITTEAKLFIKIVLAVLALMAVLIMMGCATAPKGSAGLRSPLYVVTNTTSTVATTGTNTNSVVNTQVQSFLKPQRRWSLVGLIFGEKDPISTSVPSGQSVQQGYPAPQITVVESPYPYGYYPYSYGYPYRRVYYGGGGERTLFGYRFNSR